jgi:hypothetical protein
MNETLLFFMALLAGGIFGFALGVTQTNKDCQAWWQKKREELLALAALWEDTGSRSISRRIRETMEHCASELRKIIQ